MRRPSVISITIVICCVAALYGYHRYSLYVFEEAFERYAEVAARQDEAASIPALPENPLRQDLNRVLSEALTGELSDEERAARAREGLALLVLAEGHIDAVGEIGKDVAEALFAMEMAVDRMGSVLARGKEKPVLALARERSAIVADIRGLSYRANFHTQEIFDRIIADQGALTPEHAEDLNSLIPSVEEQFNERSNLYVELDDVRSELGAAIAKVEASW